MKVLHILNELQPSGAEVMLNRAAPYWLGESMELCILSTGQSQGQYSKNLEDSGYKVFHIPFRKSCSFILDVYWLIKKQNYDVVHIHTERAFFLYALLAWLNKSPVIIRTIHSNFQFSGVNKKFRTFMRKLVSALGVTQVSVGESVQHNELARFNNQTIKISNWIDTTRFSVPTKKQRVQARQKLNVLEKTVLLSIGNCAPAKNHEVILQALHIIKAQLNRVVYFHVGKEDSAHSERKMAEDLGISERVVFVGWKEDVRNYLWAADLFLMPSNYEGFSIAALEAILCGLPTILTDVPGLSDWKELGIRSTIYSTPTSDAFAKVLASVLLSPPKIDKKEIMIIKDRYDVKRGADEYYDLYKEKLFKE
ncbi:MAG: glycosyltransferase [Anaerolineaceae bacterium]|nr:glycosyltransferase [Anaerolineaceae bacterium]